MDSCQLLADRLKEEVQPNTHGLATEANFEVLEIASR
jgi:hypothetical protein